MDLDITKERQEEEVEFFNPDTGIYGSLHKPRILPQDPFLDLASHLFSYSHNGVTALVDSLTGSSISYEELPYAVKSFAAGLHSIGIKKNDVLLIMLPNGILFPLLFLGALSVGAVVTPINPLSSLEEVEKQMKSCNFSLIFTSNENSVRLGSLGVKLVVVPETIDYDARKFHSFHGLFSSNPDCAPRPVIRQSDAAAILFSSGTSGPSKGVVLTHRNLIAAMELFVRFEASEYRYDSCKNVYLATVPMFHIYGLSLLSIGLLSLGTKIVVMRRNGNEEVAKAIDRYKVTHFPLVPPLLGALVKIKASSDLNFGSLIQVSCGAAPISMKLIQDFVEAFPSVDFIQGYGMTESCAVGTRGFNRKNYKNYASVGLLAPNTEAKVVNCETGACMPPGISGEIWLRGPGNMKGYLNDGKATLSSITNDGWLRTGDIGYFDRQGYLYILDRLKDIIKFKGFQIAPADLEAILITHENVIDAAVVGSEDEEAGEIPVAYIVRRQGSKLSANDVMQYVAKQVTPYKKVRKVVFVKSIPRSPTGKILKRQLKSNQPASRM